ESVSFLPGRPLPLSSLRLLVPPLRLVSAALWQVVQRRDTMDYGLVEEFVTTVLEITPDLMSYREKAQLVMGLQAQLVLELCRSDHSADPETIQPHLSRMRTYTEVEASESNFLELVQTLLDDPLEREHFFQEVFPEEFGPMYDTALQTLMWEFLSRLEKLLPTPTFQQTASWLRPAPSMLKECAQSVTQPQPLKTLLQHHRCHGHLFANGYTVFYNCVFYKQSYICGSDRGTTSLDTVKKAVEMTDRRNEEWGEENYEERLQYQLAYNVLQVEVVDGEDMSSTSSTTADNVGQTWTPKETEALISVWSKKPILQEMERSYREKHVYGDISEQMKELGVKRTWKQCQTKIKDMKHRYRRALRNPSSSGRATCPFFSELHTFLAATPDATDTQMPESKEAVKVSDPEVMFCDQDEGPSVDVKLENLHEEMASGKETHKTLTGMVQTYRNKHVYSEISERLKDLGVKRTWKQCQNKMKALKWRYRETLRNPSSSRPCPFFSELHEFLAAMPDMPESKETDDEEDNGKQIEIKSNFLELVQTLLDDPLEREHFFQVGVKLNSSACTIYSISYSIEILVTGLLRTAEPQLALANIEMTCIVTNYVNRMPHTQLRMHLFNLLYSTLLGSFSRGIWDTLIEQDHAGKALGKSLDTFKKAVEMTDRRNEEWGEKNYEERLQHQLAYNVLQVEIVDGEDMSSTSSMTADDVGWTCWTPDETTVLISVWSDEQILHKMEQSYRKKHVYREISECLKELGVKKTTKQCHNKIKALKWRYRETLRNPSSRPCPFFSQLHKFLRDDAFCSPQSDSKMKIPPRKLCKQMVEDIEVSERLKNIGIKRTWKQCQSKMKHMKHSYRQALRNPIQYMLRRHLIVFHKGRRLFKCPLCLKAFAFLSALKKHQSNKRDCPTSEAVKKGKELGSNNPSARITPGLPL
uniref:C2H2-type domain-containing protein n=1 Tax=Oncorhynchus mykiss TaxID=8022 RepID=A0A8C7UYH7_ONCMY